MLLSFMGVITHLFIKHTKGKPLTPVTGLSVIKDHGIAEDKNADPLSPRQILITRKEDLDELNIPYGGLRENIIVQGITQDQFKPGALITVNDQVQIKTTFYCEPCKRIADVIPSMKAVIHKRGILGVILVSGDIKLGDSVSILPGKFAPLSDHPYERFIEFVRSVPRGSIVTYKMIATGIGVSDSFIRAMPKYIERAITNHPDVPVHRIVDESRSLIIKYIPNQADLLKQES